LPAICRCFDGHGISPAGGGADGKRSIVADSVGAEAYTSSQRRASRFTPTAKGSSSKSIEADGTGIEELKWSYRSRDIVDKWSGLSMSETWVESVPLTRILQASARDMVKTTEEQIAAIGTGPGPAGLAYRAADKYSSQSVYEDKPKASGRKRFKPNVSSPRLYTTYEFPGVRRWTEFPMDSIFYAFSKSTANAPVASEYVVVGGADYNTYMRIYSTVNYVSSGDYIVRQFPNTLETLLAKNVDLEDIP
jgi:hypothetical protein